MDCLNAQTLAQGLRFDVFKASLDGYVQHSKAFDARQRGVPLFLNCFMA